MSFSRKGRRNIDQLLRDDLYFGRSSKSLSARIDQQSRRKVVQNSEEKRKEGRRIVFEKAPEDLQANELIDFSSVIVLEGMDAFVGTSSGVLKGLTLSKSSFVNLRAARQPTIPPDPSEQNEDEQGGQVGEQQQIAATAVDRKSQAITAISFTDTDQMEVLVGRANGQIDMYSSVTDQFNSLFSTTQSSSPGTEAAADGGAVIRGVYPVGSDRILTAQGSGALALWDGAGQRLSPVEWTAGDQLLTMRPGPCSATESGGCPTVFATGGKENPLKLWDLATQKCTFTAKNVRPDKLELRVPIWVTCCRFVDQTDGRCIVTSTGISQLRLYDTRAQRRPVVEEHWLDEPIQALSTCCREWHMLAGNTRGELGLFDMRTNAKSRLASKYKGFAGAIRHIDAHPSRPEMLSCGIDRFAIVHDLNSREVLRKIYCKVQLNCCLLCEQNTLRRAGGKVKK